RPPPRPPLFPYTTLFRSRSQRREAPPPCNPDGGPDGEGARAEQCRHRRCLRNVRREGGAIESGGEARPVCLMQEQRPSGLEFGRSEEHTSELQSRGHLVC